MWQYGGVPCTQNYTPPAVTRNTTQQLHVKCCALECCVGLHILQQVVYVGDNNASTLAVSVFLLLQRFKRPSGTFSYSRRFPTSLPWRVVLDAFTRQG